MAQLHSTLIARITNPRDHTSDSEHDVDLDQKDEPIVKVVKADKSRNAGNGRIRYKLSDENECKKPASNLLLAAKPASDGPEQQAAPINQNGQRRKKYIKDHLVHGV
jgi:hypothetical protein